MGATTPPNGIEERNTMDITIKTLDGGRVAVQSPYHAEFVCRSRAMAGKWDASRRAWIFPVEVLEQVRTLLRDTYGRDNQPTDTVRLRVNWDALPAEGDMGGVDSIVVGGREIARAFGRDSGARIGEDIVVVSGGFGSGGSRKNWRLTCRNNTVFDILRLPVAMAHRLEEHYPEACRIVPPDGVLPPEPVEPAEPKAD
jgi:hypothetical protein